MVQEQGSGKKYVDLHIHSTFSDGSCSIEELIDMALRKNLRAIAITDHDCVDGFDQAYELGKRVGIEVIPGVELSGETDGVDVHILGYFIDVHSSVFQSKLHEMKETRYVRAEKIVNNLNKQGIDLRFDTVLNIAGEGAIGRPHIAAAMLKEELVYSFREAFDKYIGYDCPAYVKKLTLTPKEVFKLVLDAGGIPILAHPGITSVDERIQQFIKDGLLGLEVYHSAHASSTKKHYLKFCKKNNLLFTGGSDFHSATQTSAEIGVPNIPYSVVETLAQKRDELFNKGTL